VRLRRVEHGLHVFALPAGEAERRNCLSRIALQPPGVVRIVPGFRHHLGAIARSDLLLVGLDDHIDRRRIDQPLLGKDRLQRPHPGCHRIEFIVVIMIVIVGHTRKYAARVPAASRAFNQARLRPSPTARYRRSCAS
jgi:hypothetical protein